MARPYPTQAQVIAIDVLVRFLLAEDIARAPDPAERIAKLRKAAVTLGQKMVMKHMEPKAADELAVEIEAALTHHIEFAVNLAGKGGLIPTSPPPAEQ